MERTHIVDDNTKETKYEVNNINLATNTVEPCKEMDEVLKHIEVYNEPDMERPDVTENNIEKNIIREFENDTERNEYITRIESERSWNKQITFGNLTLSQLHQMYNIMYRSSKYFSKIQIDMGTTDIKHKIILEDTTPIRTKPYRLDHCDLIEVTKHIEKLKRPGIIGKESSAYSSPIPVATKAISGTRFVNYRNPKTKQKVFSKVFMVIIACICICESQVNTGRDEIKLTINDTEQTYSNMTRLIIQDAKKIIDTIDKTRRMTLVYLYQPKPKPTLAVLAFYLK